MAKIVVVKKDGAARPAVALAVHEIAGDLCRNARLIPEAEEPTFCYSFPVPRGAASLRVEIKRSRITLTFLRGT